MRVGRGCVWLVVSLAVGMAVLVGSLARPGAGLAPRPRLAPLERLPVARFESEVLGSVSVAWSLAAANDTAPAAGLLLLFHGCTKVAEDWFTLPEGQRIVSRALARRLHVLAISSEDQTIDARHGHAQRTACWDNLWPPQNNVDIRAVNLALNKWATLTGIPWNESPLYAMGASSGGLFASIAAHALPLTAVALYVSPGNKDAWNEPFAHSALRRVAFVYMPRDTRWASTPRIARDSHTISTHGIDVKRVTIEPRPLTPAFLMERFSSMTRHVAERVCRALRRLQYISSTGEVTRAPTRALRDLLENEKELGLNYNEIRGVAEGLARCYGVHELASERVDEVLDFLQGPSRARTAP